MRVLLFATLASLLAACGGPEANAPHAHASYAGKAEPRVSTAKDRKKVSVTVYNGNFGLVREVRDTNLAVGRVGLEFRDVAQQIQPETVHIRSLTDADGLSIFEQNYRYDLLNPTTLLAKYVGKHVKLHRWLYREGREEVVDAEVMSVNESPVFKVGGEITYGYPGRLSFPEIPENLIAKPTLVWLLGSDDARQDVEVTYVTRGMTWKSDYVLTLDAKDEVADLVGWVTLTNASGANYENAELKLVAGDVQRVETQTADDFAEVTKSLEKKEDANFKEEGFFEYHLYTLGRKTSLLEKEQKQVTLLEAEGLHVDKRLVFNGTEGYFRSRLGEIGKNQKVGVYLDIQNKEDNHLGMPLPKGTVRVYKSDASGAKQFIGEDNIDHTPRDEKIRIKMGEAFDVVADRTQMSWGGLGNCGAESSWEIAVRNHKDGAERVELVEPAGGDWEIVSSSHPATRKDAHTFSFDVNVPAKGEVKVTYRVRTRWC